MLYIYIVSPPPNQRLGKIRDCVEKPQMIMVWCLGFEEGFGICGGVFLVFFLRFVKVNWRLP